jgi:ribonuclease HI
VSPNGAYVDLSIRLEFACTNNQIEYEALLHGNEYLRDLGARDVDVFEGFAAREENSRANRFGLRS